MDAYISFWGALIKIMLVTTFGIAVIAGCLFVVMFIIILFSSADERRDEHD